MTTSPTDAPTGLRRTPLHGLHTELGGRLVPFAGWELPIQYEGVMAEHAACRERAALFDVSHMAVVDLHGPDTETVARRFETVTPAGIATLAPGRQRYCLLTTDDGGVIDDAIIANLGDRLSIVVNASRRDVDLEHLGSALADVDVVERSDLALLALQGPAATAALAPLIPEVDLATLLFGHQVTTTVALPDGTTVPEVRVHRSGYTGEDGVELAVPGDRAEAVARAVLADPTVSPAGLGARDTLRLEAGLVLYGNDLDTTTSPVEADLGWTIPRRRREAADFPGAARILDELSQGPARRRVGIRAAGRRPVRDGAALSTPAGDPVGVVTSGGFGPTVGGPVAMGYVAPTVTEVGTELLADVRGRPEPVVVAQLPFVPHRYHRGA